MSFDNIGDRLVEKLRVLQYRTKHLNGTPTVSEGERNGSRVKLSLVEVAFVNEELNDTLVFTTEDRYAIWPGM